jgi:hypothetical protein
MEALHSFDYPSSLLFSAVSTYSPPSPCPPPSSPASPLSSSSSSSFYTEYSTAIQDVLSGLKDVLTSSALLALLDCPSQGLSSSLALSSTAPIPRTNAFRGGMYGTQGSSSTFKNEEESERLQALYSAQTAYLTLFDAVSALERLSGSSVRHLDVVSCSERLSGVLSNELWSSEHRVLAAAVLEHLILSTKGEVQCLYL